MKHSILLFILLSGNFSFGAIVEEHPFVRVDENNAEVIQKLSFSVGTIVSNDQLKRIDEQSFKIEAPQVQASICSDDKNFVDAPVLFTKGSVVAISGDKVITAGHNFSMLQGDSAEREAEVSNFCKTHSFVFGTISFDGVVSKNRIASCRQVVDSRYNHQTSEDWAIVEVDLTDDTVVSPVGVLKSPLTTGQLGKSLFSVSFPGIFGLQMSSTAELKHLTKSGRIITNHSAVGGSSGGGVFVITDEKPVLAALVTDSLPSPTSNSVPFFNYIEEKNCLVYPTYKGTDFPNGSTSSFPISAIENEFVE